MKRTRCFDGGGGREEQFKKRKDDHRNRNGKSEGTHPRREGTKDTDQLPQLTSTASKKRKLKFPIFGFKRLYNFLSSSSDEVILYIHLYMNDWQALLESDEMSAKSDSLILIIQILADKICCDTILIRQQMEILIKTNGKKFIAKINEKSQQICIGVESSSNKFSQMEIDKTPKTFLTSLYKFTSFVAKRMPNLAVDCLLGVIAAGFGAVLAENTKDESIISLVDQYKELNQEIKSLIKKQDEIPKASRKRGFGFTAEESQKLHAMEAPEDYRTINIIPTSEELLCDNQVFLRPNKTSGAYNDANHYLDVQFRLLREDFVQPLKRAIQDFTKNRHDYLTKKKKLPLGTIRIYPNVQLRRESELVRESFVYKVQLAYESFKGIKWDRSKRLLPGSLLVFTSDFFKTVYFATVANRNEKELSSGILSFIWEGMKPRWDTHDEYLMVESEVYFVSFRHTLRTLQELELQDFPMCKFIVFASSEVGPPKYLQSFNNKIALKLQDKEEEEVYISPLVEEDWPSNEALGLDVNQFQAFHAALTKEFAIIQGPPGTGKTFLGLKIAEAFLNNEEMYDGSPILVVCYTNHALDQFLEGILDIFANMGDSNPALVRVGGRSQSERLEDFTLANRERRQVRGEIPVDYVRNKGMIRSRIRELGNHRLETKETLMGLTDIQGIINFEEHDIFEELSEHFPPTVFTSLSNKHWYGLNDVAFESRYFQAKSVIQRWFKIRRDSGRRTKNLLHSSKENPGCYPGAKNTGLDENYDLNELLENRICDDVFAELESQSQDPVNPGDGQMVSYISGFSIQECNKTIEESEHLMRKMYREKCSPYLRRIRQSGLDRQKMIAENHRDFLETLWKLYRRDRIDFSDAKSLVDQIRENPELLSKNNLENFDIGQRWALFFDVLAYAQSLYLQKLAKIDEELINEQKKLQEIESFGKGYILQNSKVVGMTTTGAAKYHNLVKMMKSRIVIVEEAAEVLESHIVTCISKECEHLILIGDHRQLRPNTTVYELAKKFNLDVSMFERMINNNLHCYQLKEQHRMRPEIANLVVGTIYEELNNHPSVSNYEPVKGLTKNLFFISHKELETSDLDSMSKSNEHEAQFLAGLCRYLILQGYSTDRITVLTTYTGQMFLLKKAISAFPNCKEIRVTVVDNFQGEENDIILLSLVRSNVESKIGFLSIDNRICVALSRARHGLFIIGNMDSLASKSQTWTKIQEKLKNREEFGPTLELKCQVHGTISEASTDTDFIQKVPEGGCTLICDTSLECSHICKSMCHILDQEHLKEYRCEMPCIKKCENDHTCQSICFETCPPCKVRITKTLPCQHKMKMYCYEDVKKAKCMEKVTKQLLCLHEHEMHCFLDPNGFECNVIVDKKLPCGHIKNLKCHEDARLEKCKVIVTKTLVPCGHEQDVKCESAPDSVKCNTVIVKSFEACGHEPVEVRCSDVNKVTCKNPCTVRLPCGHACTDICHVMDDPDHLTYVCRKTCARSCAEGHKCATTHNCWTLCLPCRVTVEKKLPCSHSAKMECSIDPLKYKCQEDCIKQRECGHKCRRLCFQSCHPCKKGVTKTIPECGHKITALCSDAPSQSKCLESVKPVHESACGHPTLVPCRIRGSATAIEVMGYCRQPCETIFSEDEGGCGHKCKGSCKSCLQGRFHERCQEKCGKPLVCGHVCESPCSTTCPPCNKQCGMKCDHSRCKKDCGTPCSDCNEKCSWQCPHKKCTKLCREICDRGPCDEPCPRKLKCGHSCIGFCGEPCPPHCRICNVEELTEFQLYGTEGDKDARFVFLPDCEHSIEVEGLTYHMNLDETNEIGVKKCPKCTTVIRSRLCRRFGNIIRNRLQDVISVKRKIFGNQVKIQETQSALISKLLRDKTTRWEKAFPTLHRKLWEMLTKKIPETSRKGRSTTTGIVHREIDEIRMASLGLIFELAERAIDLLKKAKAELNVELYKDLISRYRDLFEMAMKRKLILNGLEVRDIGRELDRLFDLNQIYLRRSAATYTPKAAPVYELLKALVISHKPYVDKSSDQLRTLLQELDKMLKSGLGINEREKREVLQAIGMQQGHWFKCPNGHIYVITECGGAMKESKCNECGAKIGGENHRLRRDNALATEMDGAKNAAYPTTLR